MGKILDYVRWRGDLTLDREPFNSLDAGLFAAFAYLPFDSSVKGHTLEAANIIKYFTQDKRPLIKGCIILILMLFGLKIKAEDIYL